MDKEQPTTTSGVNTTSTISVKKTKTKCGCYYKLCAGDCGVLKCGCIDLCRGKCGLRS